jgi:uncharacterized protein YggE
MKLKRTLAISVIALLALSITSANAAGRYVKVNAEGTVKVVPDAVRLTATATLVAGSNKEAMGALTTVSSAVRSALRGNGVAAKDISTTSTSTYPEYNYTQDKGSVLIGYRASQSFNVVIRNAKNAGTIVDAVVAAGGDNLNLTGVTPFVLDNAKATAAARAVAVRNAKAKAMSYAKLIGGYLGKVQFIVENSSPNISAPIMAVAKDAMGTTQVDLGQQDVTVSISVRYTLN